MAKDRGPVKVIVQNRKARHDYFIEETVEAGISLQGTEVKSLRMGRANLQDSYAQVRNGEVIVTGLHISPYEMGNGSTTIPCGPASCCCTRAKSSNFRAWCRRRGSRSFRCPCISETGW
jgi:SsrA-binding protein